MTMMHIFLLKIIRKDFQIKFYAALLTHANLTYVKLANKYLIKLKSKFYYGISDTTFKEWYENHKKSFRHKEYSTEADLAKSCWEFKDKDAVPTVQFSIAKRVKGKSLINNCSLCLSEKLFIIRNIDIVNMLNKKSKFISKCHHINKRLLIKMKDDSND